jgi:hypothetical protein
MKKADALSLAVFGSVGSYLGSSLHQLDEFVGV